MLTSVSSENRFTIRAPGNEAIYAASEGSEEKDRKFWGTILNYAKFPNSTQLYILGSSRPFILHIVDKQHQEIFTMQRSFGFRCMCFPVKLQKIEVWMNNSIYIGSVTEKFAMFDRIFTINNEQDQPLYKFSISPQHSCCMPKEASFRVI